MSKNFEVKTKKALFLNGEQITDYDWDRFDIDNINEVIVATDEDNYFALFNLNGDLLFEIEDCLEYQITSKYILLKIMYINLPLYALISLEGELLLPVAYTVITTTENEDILELKMSEIIKGYYIVSTNQTILDVENFKTDSLNEYSFLMENNWKKYMLVNGKYECVN